MNRTFDQDDECKQKDTQKGRESNKVRARPRKGSKIIRDVIRFWPTTFNRISSPQTKTQTLIRGICVRNSFAIFISSLSIHSDNNGCWCVAAFSLCSPHSRLWVIIFSSSSMHESSSIFGGGTIDVCESVHRLHCTYTLLCVRVMVAVIIIIIVWYRLL